MIYKLDGTTDTGAEIIINQNRSLNLEIICDVYSGETQIGYFNFSGYTGATLEVRTNPNDNIHVLRFSTSDGSIVLGSGRFNLIKTPAGTNVRAGKYYYDMYLSSPSEPKRAFLTCGEGNRFIIKDTVTN